MKEKVKNILLILLLSIALIGSSPLAALAQEAEGASEAQSAEEASTIIIEDNDPKNVIVEEVKQDEAQSAEEATGFEDDDNDDDNEEWGSDNNNESLSDEESEADASDDTGNTNNSGNTGNTSIDTGDANASGVIQNNLNTTTLATPQCTACIGDDTTITTSKNGSGSDNLATVNYSNDSTVAIINNVTGTNDANFESNTGNNTSNNNTGGDTEISTGDANVSASVITSANQTGLGIVEYDIVENHVGDIILTLPDDFFSSSSACSTCQGANGEITNSQNGADSNNTGVINTVNNSNTSIDNDADVVNTLNIDANSGNNDASRNTGGDSSVETGDVNVAANLVNIVNSTVTDGVVFVVNVFGDLIGDIIFPSNFQSSQNGSGGDVNLSNVGNGANSNNTTSVNTANNQTINIDNNATIDNNLIVDANTGDNSTSANTGGDNSIETGDIFINAEILNIANLNVVGSPSDEPLWIILVNDMGTWSGKIIGALTGTNYTGSQGLLFDLDENGEVVVTNANNGADSNNVAEINTTNNQTTNITNDANLVNNINVNANTGGNSASNNTGGNSKIETGDVNIAASVINFVNSNFVGRKVMLGIINVFGSWTGNVVPPGQEKETSQVTSAANQESAGQNQNHSQVANIGSAIATGVLGSFNQNQPVAKSTSNSNNNPQAGQVAYVNGSSSLTITPLNIQAGGMRQDLRLVLAVVSALLFASIFLKRKFFLN